MENCAGGALERMAELPIVNGVGVEARLFLTAIMIRLTTPKPNSVKAAMSKPEAEPIY